MESTIDDNFYDFLEEPPSALNDPAQLPSELADIFSPCIPDENVVESFTNNKESSTLFDLSNENEKLKQANLEIRKYSIHQERLLASFEIRLAETLKEKFEMSKYLEELEKNMESRNNEISDLQLKVEQLQVENGQYRALKLEQSSFQLNQMKKEINAKTSSLKNIKDRIGLERNKLSENKRLYRCLMKHTTCLWGHLMDLGEMLSQVGLWNDIQKRILENEFVNNFDMLEDVKLRDDEDVLEILNKIPAVSVEESESTMERILYVHSSFNNASINHQEALQKPIVSSSVPSPPLTSPSSCFSSPAIIEEDNPGFLPSIKSGIQEKNPVERIPMEAESSIKRVSHPTSEEFSAVESSLPQVSDCASSAEESKVDVAKLSVDSKRRLSNGTSKEFSKVGNTSHTSDCASSAEESKVEVAKLSVDSKRRLSNGTSKEVENSPLQVSNCASSVKVGVTKMSVESKRRLRSVTSIENSVGENSPPTVSDCASSVKESKVVLDKMSVESTKRLSNGTSKEFSKVENPSQISDCASSAEESKVEVAKLSVESKRKLNNGTSEEFSAVENSPLLVSNCASSVKEGKVMVDKMPVKSIKSLSNEFSAVENSPLQVSNCASSVKEGKVVVDKMSVESMKSLSNGTSKEFSKVENSSPQVYDCASSAEESKAVVAKMSVESISFPNALKTIEDSKEVPPQGGKPIEESEGNSVDDILDEDFSFEELCQLKYKIGLPEDFVCLSPLPPSPKRKRRAKVEESSEPSNRNSIVSEKPPPIKSLRSSKLSKGSSTLSESLSLMENTQLTNRDPKISEKLTPVNSLRNSKLSNERNSIIRDNLPPVKRLRSSKLSNRSLLLSESSSPVGNTQLASRDSKISESFPPVNKLKNSQLSNRGSKKSKWKKKKKGKNKRGKKGANKSKVIVPNPVSLAFEGLWEMRNTGSHSLQAENCLLNVLIDPNNVPNSATLLVFIFQFLLKSSYQSILLYMRTNGSSDLIPVEERSVVELLLKIEQLSKPHLQNLLESALNTLHQVILSKTQVHLYPLSSLCRVLTLICYHKQNPLKPLSLCCDLLKMKHQFAPYLIASVAGVWRDIFKVSNDMQNEEKIFHVAIAYGAQKNINFYSEAIKDSVEKFLKEFLSAPSVPDVINSIVEYLINKILNECSEGLCPDLEFALTSPLIIFAVHGSWSWTKEFILDKYIIPSLKKYGKTEVNLPTFNIFCNLYVEIFSMCPDGVNEEVLTTFFEEGNTTVHDVTAAALMKLHLLQNKSPLPSALFEWCEKNKENPFLKSSIEVPLRRKITSDEKNITIEDIIS